MKARLSIFLFLSFVLASACLVSSQEKTFHNAPASAASRKNPYAGQPEAVKAGEKAFAKTCASCHGQNARGTGNVPSLAKASTQAAKDGALFWYITKGDAKNGMPSWAFIPERERWQIVAFVKTLDTASATEAPLPLPPASVTRTDAPAPQAPFTDFRFEEPGRTRHITMADLPAPYATKSASHGPSMVRRPANAWPKTLPDFQVDQFATGLQNPRLLRTAPNGDVFLAETGADDVKVFRGITADGKPQQVETFATGLNEPFGISFYPPGDNPQFVYVANTNSVVRFPYQNGDLKARGRAQHIADLPDHDGHSTRDIQFSLDGKKMFVSVGSASNVDDTDTNRAEKNRADILEFNPDGSGMRIYAYGIRNAVGLAVNPKSGELWCSVNERDGLGDNLVPDYITHVQDGGFYGWPWWYMGGHQDPRHQGKHPELKDKVITPDVPLQPHNASLELTFYQGTQYPREYRGDIFAAEHGSWNKSVRAGYEVIRIPLHQSGHADGEYEDFLTGFVVDNDHVWGRPVGITVAKDGSLLVSDDGSNTIWRVSYVGK